MTGIFGGARLGHERTRLLVGVAAHICAAERPGVEERKEDTLERGLLGLNVKARKGKVARGKPIVEYVVFQPLNLAGYAHGFELLGKLLHGGLAPTARGVDDTHGNRALIGVEQRVQSVEQLLGTGRVVRRIHPGALAVPGNDRRNNAIRSKVHLAVDVLAKARAVKGERERTAEVGIVAGGDRGITDEVTRGEVGRIDEVLARPRHEPVDRPAIARACPFELVHRTRGHIDRPRQKILKPARRVGLKGKAHPLDRRNRARIIVIALELDGSRVLAPRAVEHKGAVAHRRRAKGRHVRLRRLGHRRERQMRRNVRKVRVRLGERNHERPVIGAGYAAEPICPARAKLGRTRHERQKVGMGRDPVGGACRARGVEQALPCALKARSRYGLTTVEHPIAQVKRNREGIVRDLKTLRRAAHEPAGLVIKARQGLKHLPDDLQTRLVACKKGVDALGPQDGDAKALVSRTAVCRGARSRAARERRENSRAKRATHKGATRDERGKVGVTAIHGHPHKHTRPVLFSKTIGHAHPNVHRRKPDSPESAAQRNNPADTATDRAHHAFAARRDPVPTRTRSLPT